jgi:prolyl-tRNA editing enzyme YbaK/EbsC (Cys-tRNA(Pro) deacylase)
VARADADWVREKTGYAIGGVPPVGHPAPVRTLMDDDLMRFDTVWAAAGTPRTVFPIAPAELARVTGAAPARRRG